MPIETVADLILQVERADLHKRAHRDKLREDETTLVRHRVAEGHDRPRPVADGQVDPGAVTAELLDTARQGRSPATRRGQPELAAASLEEFQHLLLRRSRTRGVGIVPAHLKRSHNRDGGVGVQRNRSHGVSVTHNINRSRIHDGGVDGGRHAAVFVPRAALRIQRAREELIFSPVP